MVAFETGSLDQGCCLKLTALELNAILENNLVPSHGGKIHHASLLNSSITQVNCVGGMAGIEPMPSKSNDWTPLSPCQLGQGGSGGKIQLLTFCSIQWECVRYSRRPRAQCYPLDLAGHCIRGKNSQVQVFHVT